MKLFQLYILLSWVSALLFAGLTWALGGAAWLVFVIGAGTFIGALFVLSLCNAAARGDAMMVRAGRQYHE